jgi:penicillin-binding protein 2
MAERDGLELPTGNRRFTRRSLLLAGAQAAGLSLVGWRLFGLQVLERGHYAPIAEENRINLQILAPRRGRILDVAGRPLADNEAVFRATVTPSLVKDLHDVLGRVQQILPLSDKDVADILRRAKRQRSNVPIVIATELAFDQIAKINLFAPSLPGIATGTSWRRRYHGGDAIGHVVGFVGSVESLSVDDDAVLRLPEMKIGKTGAEAGFESELRGLGGTQKIEVDARGRIVRKLETVEPANGRDITLSIDADLQEQVLARLQRERCAAAVVLDIKSGAILVSSSAPGFDPASIAGGISIADWQKLTTAEDKPLLNRVVAGQYAPGSTFKVVTALAALEAGVVLPTERIPCPGHYDFAGEVYPCWKPDGHGELTLHDALRCACDVYFYEIARRTGIDRLASMARRLGLGTIYDFGLPDEKAGVIPDPNWKRGDLGVAWLGGETLLTGIGQGYVQATPLQLALMTARIAAGRIVLPSIRKTTSPPDSDFATLSIDAAHLELVRAGMLGAVNDDGGAGKSAKRGAGRPPIAGEVGSSWIGSGRTQGDPRREGSARDHSLFVAFAPANVPRYAIATVVEHAGDGNAAAAPLARDVLNFVLDHNDRNQSGKNASGDGPAAAPRTNGTAG